MNDKSLIQSYVWHDYKCFFVTTFDRDSSAMLGPRRYAETFVYEFDWNKNEKLGMISQHCGLEGSIFTHFQVCQFLHETGKSEIPEETL